MANPEHLAILKQGVEVWNRWRDQHRDAHLHADLRSITFGSPDLSGADLKGTMLRTANFRRVRLTGADLSSADLLGAHFGHADLIDADLSRSKLIEAYFIGTDLRRANLSYASIFNTQIRGANLSGANLEWASLNWSDLIQVRVHGTNFKFTGLGWTVIAGTDLSDAANIESALHSGPSYIDLDTIRLSKGKLPEVFLRGVGIPDSLIASIWSLTQNEFYSCFISYSTLDQEFADRLCKDLQKERVHCWFAPHDIKGGKKLHEQIDEAIRIHDRLLLILSEASMNSEWVKTEIANARQREIREKRQMLFPISLVPFSQIRDWRAYDADTGKDSAREIREFFIPDFSNWTDSASYQAAFQRLLRDLKVKL